MSKEFSVSDETKPDAPDGFEVRWSFALYEKGGRLVGRVTAREPEVWYAEHKSGRCGMTFFAHPQDAIAWLFATDKAKSVAPS